MISYDVDVRSEDVQLLNSRDALTAFFARLGYNTNDRLTQTIAAMNITGDALASTITHIERIASQDGGFFEVYLFELRSVTVAATQGIVRSFRNRPGDYLLVLTDDYERLDFVLVERYTPQSQGQAQEAEQFAFVPPTRTVSVRPRVLTVTRRHPDQVALRVLRRFSYTESDTFAHYDKLISAYDVAEWSRPYFNNRALFSDYYLTERLPHDAVWTNPATASTMTHAYRTLRELYASVRDTFANLPADQYRAQLLEPVFHALGFAVGASFSSPPATSAAMSPATTTISHPEIIQPDYRLFSSQPAGETRPHPLALCLAYPWNRNLDGKDEQRDPLRPDDNPGASVVTLLDSGEAGWAIVTNGKLWRLYAASAHSRATNYYEIDLEETLALPVEHLETAFRYFWLLFRAAAFMPDAFQTEGETHSTSFLAWLMGESERYARRLGERLKGRVFDEIFPHFARGFITDARHRGQLPTNLEDLPQDERNRLLEPFFNGTLTFLYRLLFLLYAESRDLLPVREERGYYPHSLETLKREIAIAAGTIVDEAPARISATYSEQKTTFYDRLQTLFSAVDKGNPALNVPVYNGGLFVTQPDSFDTSAEAVVAAFLASCKIPDRQLALGLDRMARDVDERRHDLAFIDYKSLGVRQLGSIYEGLLEFRLRVAPEAMVGVQGKKTEEIVPQSEAERGKLKVVRERRDGKMVEKSYPRGFVYLENDRRERKATGSYYTPDYIVKYIVEHTVGPVLHDKLDALRTLFREAERVLRNERDKAKALKRPDISPEHETYKKYRQSLNEAFFDLKVLDPAMGSGHFLVEAVDYITDRMADFLASFRWNPVVYELAQTRREIESAMEAQGISIDAGKLTDLNLLKRQVLKRCIYGVDLNPMAVELARVSLWLDCFTLGAPLSFLDHHMKHGNSLIGGRIDEVQEALGSTLWGSQFAYLLDATQLMRRVGQLSDVTAQEVAESRKAYRGASDALAPFKRLLDVWTSEYFANKGAQKMLHNEAGAIFNHDYRALSVSDNATITTAYTLAASRHFFHWELEFPEVFYDSATRKENGGFDAVVGNPPYVRQEGLGDDKAAFKVFFQVFNSISDLYTYFIERGHILLRQGGRFSMITANKFMRANYGAALRSFLTTNVKLETLIDFGELRVFGDAATDPLITVSSKELPSGNVIYVRVKSLVFESLDSIVQENSVALPESAFNGSNWSLAADVQQTILDKLKRHNIPLGKYVDGKIRRGILTGFNEAFVIDRMTRDKLMSEDPNSAEVIKPFLIGDDVRKYECDFQERYLIWTYIGIPINQYQAIYKHLHKYQAQLERRWDKGNHWWELRHCDYYSDFEKPKILYPEIAMSSRFILDEDTYYTNNKAFLIAKDDKYLLALLNSALLWAYLKKICSILGDAENGGRLELRSVHVETVPIRLITFILTPEQRAAHLAEAQTLYSAYLATDDGRDMLAFVAHHLAQQPEQSDVVHDLLAFLAEEMIRLNKEKRAAMKQFLGELETTLRIVPDREGRGGIESLTGKSKVFDYPGDYQKGESELAFDELLEILRKNRTRLGLTLNDTAFVERLRQRYEESLSLVLPLKDRLARTDVLIDQVVYRLYGLTEEEVRVVEGKG